MKKYSSILKIVLLVGIITSTNLLSQSLEELYSCVAFLSKSVSKDSVLFGTGFFIISEKNHPYLITADHISGFLTSDADITIRKEKDRPYTFKLFEILKNKNTQWKRHKKADIALLQLNLNDNYTKILQGHFFPISQIYSKKESLSKEITITIIGFPLALGIDQYFSPISRETKLASGFVTLKRFDKNIRSTFIITQEPSVGGFSGAPVFDTGLPIQSQGGMTLRRMPSTLVGLVHGTLSDNTGGKFGALVPSYQILELIFENE